ncbi:uncharacterized protein FOMMEDRAFT_137295 [Fomitiporia mediterranea MF3/22]|uniref:uncharacterized protein n=1 Tax=Fomitiporia mediterranea (strain MF3/22) TaxID=694068 RepID=UPI00044073DB|nr:uncharacterized protein FOMMEDRAFT_137295 [Fomitiporia mediterranea MF3/22]EJC97903.1 hypothetical protein FOMMEDRAFT_137295 [Fomitiporia mediterranea MF3/22]
MAIMDENYERDLMKLWTLVGDLSEQLSQTKGLADTLRSHSMILKAQALHTETGFVLRRFNLHLSQEEYDAELERMNSSLSQENQGLQYDNKQLNSLLKEYEQTLDQVMSTFRKHAHDVQLRELETIKLYEQLLIASESGSLDTQLAADTSVSVLIAKCSRLLRMVLRLMGGEEPTPPSLPSPPPSAIPSDDSSSYDKVETRCAPELADSISQDWALEREIELSRLEQENAELRMLLQAADAAAAPSTLPPSLPKVPVSAIRSLMPRRTRLRGNNSFSSESSVGEFRVGQYGHGEHQGLLDMSEEVL